MRIKVTADNKFLSKLPDNPGVYRYYDVDGNLLYVGKAISLVKRVKSYFQKKAELSPRISLMVSKIVELEITITENETSALLLENNLIKSLKPKYNIIFRDDKSYPYIKISEHSHPLIEYYRGKPHKGATFYGPYPNSYAVRETLDLLQRLFKLRTCTDSVFANRSRPCMLYQVNRCSAPCVNKISEGDYSQSVKNARRFLNGDYPALVNQLTTQMYEASDQLDFEQAGILRDKIALIKQMQDKQIISDTKLPINSDLILYKEANGHSFIYLIIIRNGLYIGDKYFVVRTVDNYQGMVEAFLENYYTVSKQNFSVYIEQEIAPEFIDYFVKAYNIRIISKSSPRIKDLGDMGRVNLEKIVENYKIDNIYQLGSLRLCELIGIKGINRIECYDTSHNQGSSAVASMVVYSDGKIDNKLYRRFNLPNEINGDDLLALESVLRRRLMNSELDVPELILVDGGRNQLSVAKKLLKELGFYDKIKIIAIFKGEDRKPELDKVIINSELELNFRQEPHVFRLLQALRDEAHRFAITGHRKKQAEKMKFSRLEDIPGIGAQKRKTLIAFFGSSQGVAAASVEELQQVQGIGVELATAIYDFFHTSHA